MFIKKPAQPGYRSYLSPQSLRKYPTVQSPKFNKQKALQNQQERMRINEERLNRLDQYNSMLSAKANEEFIPARQGLSIENNPLDFNKKSSRTKFRDDHNDISQNQIGSFNQNNNKKRQKQMYLELLRQSNNNLHKNNSDFQLYLKEISSGVSELQCILQEVEFTHSKLAQINPEFKGLWISHDAGENDYLSVQKNTRATFESEQDPLGRIIHTRDHDFLMPQNNQTYRNSRLEQIEQLQVKFKQILNKIQTRSIHKLRKCGQVRELNAIEMQIDKLQQMKSNSTLKNVKSEGKIKIHSYLQPREERNIKPLSKVRSFERIFGA